MRLPNSLARSRQSWLAVPLLAMFAAAAFGVFYDGGPEPKAKPAIRYGRDIRPILSDRCFKCHGGDPKSREANLRLDERESALSDRKGKRAIVPGKPEESELWHRINESDAAERMPPATSHKKQISEDEKKLIRAWIEAGAEYEPHWAFVPPVRPALPEVKNANAVRNPIDRFIIEKLESEGLEPSPEASRATLCRRLFLDLTGLPPTPEELAAFEQDKDPEYYEKWVDKLLGEEPWRTRYAERMTAPWLDVSRYADTCGIHMDAGRSIWPWRDWVIRAFRDNMPFDQFTTEQIAGDLLPGATREQKIASGFNRNHVTTDEGGAIAEEYLVEYAVDRVSTTGAVFLGLTLGCARCHEHKFDPVSQKEFYELYAFFNSIDEPGLYSQLPDANRAHEPNLRVPSPEQETSLAELNRKLGEARAAMDSPIANEAALRAAYVDELQRSSALRWELLNPKSAASAGGAQLEILGDGSVLASGPNPARDDHSIVAMMQETNCQFILLEALTHASLPGGRVGRAFNGNAVLTGIEVEAASLRDPAKTQKLQFDWAWANHEQSNGDFRIVNVMDPSDNLGWAVQGHEREGGRVAVLRSKEPFGYEGGTELRVQLQYRSVYDGHTLGRVRLSAGKSNDTILDRLPIAQGDWYQAGPFATQGGAESYEKTFGPETAFPLDLRKTFGAASSGWKHLENRRDGAVHELPGGTNVTYVARRLFAPSDRKLDVSLGSDDGVIVYVNGVETFRKVADRPAAPDQDRTTLPLRRGENTVLLKIVNTGGQAGFYYKPLQADSVMAGDLMAAALPATARASDLDAAFTLAWKLFASPEYRKRRDEVKELEGSLAKLESEIPLTMIMKELDKPRDTFVLTRGLYDHPDKKQPVSRAVPAALGALPSSAPRNRLGLAHWLVSPQNPLVARVTVNRLWEQFFGVGIVKTTEDFGAQGEWPTHPELLDWLAVEFRESGWDVKKFVKTLVTSATYRQASRGRDDVKDRDPENRWLSFFPRRRLSAEQIRDQALYISGLLVEKAGGPSVRPYQPPGLWEEVAMPQSNTRIYVRDNGDGLYRRSMYTYWKRASPPPSMLMLDAPTREFCTIRRTTTNTPLQALVLWNDEQFLEASRWLAERIVETPGGDDGKFHSLFLRCCGRPPDAQELELLRSTLDAFRQRYRGAVEDARKLLVVGASRPTTASDPSEFASWMLLCSATLSTDACISKY